MAQLIIDTSGYLAGTAAAHPLHDTVLKVLGSVRQPPVISPLVIAEIDYMVLDKAGVARELAVIDDLTSGAYELPDLDLDDLRTARRLVARHQDLKIGMTDAVNAVLAERYDTNEILTTDQRHFRAIAPLTRRFEAFRILPADLLPVTLVPAAAGRSAGRSCPLSVRPTSSHHRSWYLGESETAQPFGGSLLERRPGRRLAGSVIRDGGGPGNLVK